jgi:hypothetical protein
MGGLALASVQVGTLVLIIQPGTQLQPAYGFRARRKDCVIIR